MYAVIRCPNCHSSIDLNTVGEGSLRKELEEKNPSLIIIGCTGCTKNIVYNLETGVVQLTSDLFKN